MLKNFALTRGDVGNYTITITDGNTPYDISNWYVIFTLKTSYDLPDTDLTFQRIIGPGQHSDPVHGITTLTLHPIDTALLASRIYDYDLVVITDAGDPYTILKGKFDLQYDVNWDHTTSGTAGTAATIP